MKKRKIAALIALLVLAAALLSSCHGTMDQNAAKEGFVSEIPLYLDETRKIELTFWAKNDTNKEIRLYKNETMTISVSGSAQIQSIVITASTAASDANEHLCDQFAAGLPEGCTVSDDKITATWTGSAPSVTFTASGAQVRISQVNVIYLP